MGPGHGWGHAFIGMYVDIGRRACMELEVDHVDRVGILTAFGGQARGTPSLGSERVPVFIYTPIRTRY